MASCLLLIVVRSGRPPLFAALEAWLLTLAGAVFLRSGARMLWRRITPRERTFIIGSGTSADAIRRKVELFADIHLQLVESHPDIGVEQLLRSPEVIDSLDRIILATGTIDEELLGELIGVCRRRKVKLSVVPIDARIGTAAQLTHVADLAILEYNTWDVSRSTMLLKRGMDIVGSVALLILFAPLFVLIAVAVLLESGRPVFFKQTRAGLHGRRFWIYKFRTMVEDAEERLPQIVRFDELTQPVFKLESDPRVTRVGHQLRRCSLDELPQLFNVLRGEMSLVGPRPEQAELVDRYTPEQRLRLAVRPGLTGPMQVYGRGALGLEERLSVERDYIENLSLGRDLGILAMTASAVFRGSGAF